MKRALLSSVGAILVLGSTEIRAQEDVSGEALYQSVCKNCHGPTAKGMASFPKLAGRTADYLEERLGQYRAGDRVGPNTALMRPHAAERHATRHFRPTVARVSIAAASSKRSFGPVRTT